MDSTTDRKLNNADISWMNQSKNNENRELVKDSNLIGNENSPNFYGPRKGTGNVLNRVFNKQPTRLNKKKTEQRANDGNKNNNINANNDLNKIHIKEQSEEQAKKYQEEILANTMPRRVKNIIDLSTTVREEYERKKRLLRVFDMWLCIFAFIAIAMVITDTEEISTHYSILENKFRISNVNVAVRCVILLMNLLSVIFIVLRYRTLMDLHRLRIGSIAKDDSYVTAGLFWKFVIELLLNMVFLPPNVEGNYQLKGTIYVNYRPDQYFDLDFLNSTTTNSTDDTLLQTDISNYNYRTTVVLYYGLSNAIAIFILFRCYHFVRVIYTYSYWATPRADTICKLMNTEATIGFGIKAYLKISPFTSLGVGIFFLILFFGLGLKIFEYYNCQMIEILDSTPAGFNSSFATVMKKFYNVLNSFWLVVVTMTTIGYGDIYPTTYFGRLLAVVACIFGTFVISLLVVFLNNVISFDEVEKHIYNSVVEEKASDDKLKQFAGKMIFQSLLYHYLKEKRKKTTKIYRLFLTLDLNYKAKEFKLFRMNHKKIESDIDDILGKIKYNFDTGIVPLKSSIEAYNKERVLSDHSHNYLRDSNLICESVLKQSSQMINLLKVINNKQYLKDLNSIDEVYDNHATMIEEIVHFHNQKYYQRNQMQTVETLNEENIDLVQRTNSTM